MPRFTLAGRAPIRLATVLVAAALTALDLAPAQALEPLRERQRIETQSRTQGIDLEILRQRTRRENFQRSQSNLREVDRRKAAEPRLDLPVRRLKRNCQLQPYGATFLPNCR